MATPTKKQYKELSRIDNDLINQCCNEFHLCAAYCGDGINIQFFMNRFEEYKVLDHGEVVHQGHHRPAAMAVYNKHL